jgi:hypothetical protein
MDFYGSNLRTWKSTLWLYSVSGRHGTLILEKDTLTSVHVDWVVPHQWSLYPGLVSGINEELDILARVHVNLLGRWMHHLGDLPKLSSWGRSHCATEQRIWHRGRGIFQNSTLLNKRTVLSMDGTPAYLWLHLLQEWVLLMILLVGSSRDL